MSNDKELLELASEHAPHLIRELAAIVKGYVEQVAHTALAVPDGYVLMPVEPTAGICKAAADGWLDCGSRLVLNKAGAAYRSSVAYYMKKGTHS